MKRERSSIMIVVGVVGVVGVVAGAIVHDDHSNYGDSYSKYGDASLKNEIQAKSAKIEQYEKDLQRVKQVRTENFDECVREIKAENGGLLPSDFNSRREYYKENSESFKSAVKRRMQEKLESEISREQQELKDIDALLNQINKSILTKK